MADTRQTARTAGTARPAEAEPDQASAGRVVDVALADKNPLVLSALSELLDRDPRFNLVLTVKTSSAFLQSVARTRVDIGVIGWALPPGGGGAILETLRDQPEAPRIVVYSGGLDPDLARKVMGFGAAGFCSKSEAPERLLDTIAAVAAGQMVFPYVDVRGLHSDPWDHLTPRERELLAALAKGDSNDQIARALGLSINTVKFHLRNLYDKLAIKNRAQAVAFFYSTTRDS
ncbi:MAG: response regulator transcription factor [Kiloniellales bacterium]|nr:response regulator transcription factor [Kiloniellales bacterium]